MSVPPPSATAMGEPLALIEVEGRGYLFSGLASVAEVATAQALAAALPGGAGAEEAAAGEGDDGPWHVFALDYELAYAFEPTARLGLSDRRPRQAARAPGRVWRFRERHELSAEELSIWLAGIADEAPAGIAEAQPSLDEAAYVAAVERICDYIAAGDCYQVNFTFPLHFAWFGDPLALYRALRRLQPARFGGVLRVPGATVLSLSPELFVRREGRRLVCRPMKGTAPRGATPVEDAARRQALQDSPKDRAENVMIVDLLRNDLGRIAPAGAVSVDALFAVEAYPTLFQLTSTVSADAPGVPAAEVLRALFPCGSITGAPKVRAMQIIGELERTPRGLYTGSLGYAGPRGEFVSNVAIRTLVLDDDGRGTMGVGSGIVADSLPAAEYRECLLKASFLTRRDPGLQLIETLRLEAGRYPRLERHLARLQRSAKAFGFACDLDAVRDRLQGLADAPPGRGEYDGNDEPGVQRVRLTLAWDGRIALTHAPLDTQVPDGGWTACWAAEPVASDDVLLRHKTTARARYDRELARLASLPGVFDALFVNERGELCEGARSNLFVRLDGRLLTPAAACGLLPGVLRGELLASGEASEAVLRPADLLRAEAVFLGNALRGLVAVRVPAPPAPRP